MTFTGKAAEYLDFDGPLYDKNEPKDYQEKGSVFYNNPSRQEKIIEIVLGKRENLIGNVKDDDIGAKGSNSKELALKVENGEITIEDLEKVESSITDLKVPSSEECLGKILNYRGDGRTTTINGVEYNLGTLQIVEILSIIGGGDASGVSEILSSPESLEKAIYNGLKEYDDPRKLREDWYDRVLGRVAPNGNTQEASEYSTAFFCLAHAAYGKRFEYRVQLQHLMKRYFGVEPGQDKL